jgi:hypothetical protein
MTPRTTLCEIRDDLHVPWRIVAGSRSIQGIDALIGAAEAIKVIRRIDRHA